MDVFVVDFSQVLVRLTVPLQVVKSIAEVNTSSNKTLITTVFRHLYYKNTIAIN